LNKAGTPFILKESSPVRFDDVDLTTLSLDKRDKIKKYMNNAGILDPLDVILDKKTNTLITGNPLTDEWYYRDYDTNTK
jgi:hypothetical protein